MSMSWHASNILAAGKPTILDRHVRTTLAACVSCVGCVCIVCAVVCVVVSDVCSESAQVTGLRVSSFTGQDTIWDRDERTARSARRLHKEQDSLEVP